MTANIWSLNNRMEKTEVQLVAPLPQPLSSSDSGSVPVYGCPSITAIPSHLQVPGLDLQNKHTSSGHPSHQLVFLCLYLLICAVAFH